MLRLFWLQLNDVHNKAKHVENQSLLFSVYISVCERMCKINKKETINFHILTRKQTNSED